MFDEMVVSSPNAKRTNKPWTVVLSMIFQTAFLAVLILIPLIYTEALPKTMMATLLVAPASATASSASSHRPDGARQAASALDGCWQTGDPQGHPKGHQDY